MGRRLLDEVRRCGWDHPMSLKLVSASPDVAALAKPRLLYSLRKQLQEGPNSSITISHPQPLYTATTDDVLEHTITNAELPDAWQLLVLRADEPLATLEMRIERDSDGEESYHYAGVFIGPYTRSIYMALNRAEIIASETSLSYELRVLRIPTVYLYAVWLHAENSNLIIPCAPAPGPLEPNHEMEPDAVCDALRDLADKQSSGEYEGRLK